MIITQTPFRMSFFGGGTDMESFFRENMTGNDHALEKADPLELAEIKRRWEPYINQLPDYAYLCKDLLNGKM